MFTFSPHFKYKISTNVSLRFDIEENIIIEAFASLCFAGTSAMSANLLSKVFASLRK